MKSMWKVRGCAMLVGGVLLGWQAVAAAAPFAYVMLPSASSVAVIDIANNTVIATISNLGDLSTISGIAAAPDGSRVYVVDQGGNSAADVNVYVIDVANNPTMVADTIQVPSSYALAVTP